MKEKPLRSLNGLGVIAAVLVIAMIGGLFFLYGLARPNALALVLGFLLAALALLALIGLYTVQPNQAAVLSLFG